ncbi:hypothetical protein KKC94_04210 [Patescibacteria group bacterium]|nr:hypothetical protein [Patescibacteria group bacterium]
MKKITTLLLTFIVGTVMVAPTSMATEVTMPEDQEDYQCGLWEDVPESYLEVITDVCERGLMYGYDEYTFGFGDDALRVGAAALSSRIADGEDQYYGVMGTTEATELKSRFYDMPVFTQDTYWIYTNVDRATRVGTMRGDGTDYVTSFRPLDTINKVEIFKVLYEALRIGNALGANVTDENISYYGGVWYEDLMNKMEDEGVIYDLDLDDEYFVVSTGGITKSFRGFDDQIRREDAALIIHSMIEHGLADETSLQRQLGL